MANQRYTGPLPINNPDTFRIVPFEDVQRGDIFQGRQNPTKWYVTEGIGKDSRYTYYRPIAQGSTGGGRIGQAVEALIAAIRDEFAPKKEQGKSRPSRKRSAPKPKLRKAKLKKRSRH